MGITLFKISYREVYRRIYVRKSRFQLRLRVAVKLNFRRYIRRYTSPNDNLDTVIPQLNDGPGGVRNVIH